MDFIQFYIQHSHDVEGSWRISQEFLFFMNGSGKIAQSVGQQIKTDQPRAPICWSTGRSVLAKTNVWRVGYHSFLSMKNTPQSLDGRSPRVVCSTCIRKFSQHLLPKRVRSANHGDRNPATEFLLSVSCLLWLCTVHMLYFPSVVILRTRMHVVSQPSYSQTQRRNLRSPFAKQFVFVTSSLGLDG